MEGGVVCEVEKTCRGEEERRESISSFSHYKFNKLVSLVTFNALAFVGILFIS